MNCLYCLKSCSTLFIIFTVSKSPHSTIKNKKTFSTIKVTVSPVWLEFILKFIKNIFCKARILLLLLLLENIRYLQFKTCVYIIFKVFYLVLDTFFLGSFFLCLLLYSKKLQTRTQFQVLIRGCKHFTRPILSYPTAG